MADLGTRAACRDAADGDPNTRTRGSPSTNVRHPAIVIEWTKRRTPTGSRSGSRVGYWPLSTCPGSLLLPSLSVVGVGVGLGLAVVGLGLAVVGLGLAVVGLGVGLAVATGSTLSSVR